MTQYKFLSADLISINGFTYTIGEWTPPVDPKIGVSGYHVIVRERLIFWCSGIAPRLFEVETRGACDGPDRLGRSARQSVRLAREITGWGDGWAGAFDVVDAGGCHFAPSNPTASINHWLYFFQAIFSEASLVSPPMAS